MPPFRPGEVYGFLVLACGITWALDLPLAFAYANHASPPAYAMPLVALGAFGPTLAALAITPRRRVPGGPFGRWRTRPLWILVALLTPAAVHLPATLCEIAFGGHPAHWFYPPTRPELVVAMVVFSFGEELGWRGFAYPRLAQRHGPVAGALIVGAVWGLWHLGMLFTPEHGAPDELTVLAYVVELALWSVVIAWLLECGGGGLWIAIALHAGAHLDDVYRAPEGEVRLRVLRFVTLALTAALAARRLTRARSAMPVLAAPSHVP